MLNLNHESLFSDLICLSVDVDWAVPAVLLDMLQLLEERGLRATLFCTHAGIDPRGHERALHPNFRPSGDSMRKLRQETGDKFATLPEEVIYGYVVELTQSFCPEAIGVRAHSLIYDSQLLSIYKKCNLQYESNYLLPLVEGLKPFWKEYNLVEIPIFFNDHFELKSHATRFQLDKLNLRKPGLKVLQFHPNMVFINAQSNHDYLESRAFYHDADKLQAFRKKGRGIRDFFIELLDLIAKQHLKTATLAEVNHLWRQASPYEWD